MRRKEREVTNFEEQVRIASRCTQVILGMVDKGKAYMVPVDFGYKVVNGKLSLYIHSAAEGHKMDILKKDPHITFTMAHSFRIGLGDTKQFWTNAYESLMGEATVTFLDDFDERLESTQLLMDRYEMGPIPEAAYATVKHMACYRIDIETMTGKSNLKAEERDNWGKVEEIQRLVNDPRVTLSRIKEMLK